jgi:hypothetical protein
MSDHARTDRRGGDLEAFSLPEEVTELVAPEPLRFAPWHRPRKQYVRKFQWIKHAQGIVKELRGLGYLENGEPLKYLTLPGPDLLDIRVLAQMCSEEQVSLKYTGFCRTSQTEAERLRRNVQQFSIDHNDIVAKGSEVSPARIEDVVIANSDAEALLRLQGPFDFINIDACGPLINQDLNQTGRLVDAIRKIVEFQLHYTRRPWALCLTTVLQTDSVSAASLDSLHRQIEVNSQNDAEFGSELSKQFEADESLRDYLTRASLRNGATFVQSGTLGLSKWLIHLADQGNFSAKLMTTYCYSNFGQEPFEPNMISLCYLFFPNALAIRDLTGLTLNNEAVQTTPPISNHLRALRKSLEMENLDTLLSQRPELRTMMIDETKRLLREAGYNNVDHPSNGYDRWLAGLAFEAANSPFLFVN